MVNRAFLSIGSNIGKRERYLYEAIQSLEKHSIKVNNFSSIFETDPVGFTEQDLFLNMVIEIETEKNPHELLEICLDIEQQLDRKRIIHWGPRTIDLDIILFNEDIIHTKDLIIPHPRMHERAFVLVPLAEINGEIVIPNINRTVDILLHQINKTGVRLWKKKQDRDINKLFN
ncbi:2-amino-4-hydroxy-6-hydroxymethyldihydropteridine diphosphokinase [Pallidibacillus pasinlerensis]|uniref:2-amino-4-hydroxy-6-hydroxymethyldihydropteridine diphosphokinase n=1 Tax=Pallidibacillus pasinlerensis TaxID=2703818 RepID=A0ABX0A5E0_9BACI|nr:2-amino-4-hydroxy-6-hydroxymethyldihydropteridine diphosphokinase [Pallidibacillus pasinlerensis]NCU17724.1 2-amino-4-hydroxy-6-hydroxymethyldihydropteridine diphosphokinase [Pallidibacillus pasinlerensis]